MASLATKQTSPKHWFISKDYEEIEIILYRTTEELK